MYARSVSFTAQPGTMDEGITFVRDEVMPFLQSIDGNIGMSMICDRDSGRCIVTSAWATEQAMNASEPAMQPIRARGAEIFGTSPQVEFWEIATLHRHQMSTEGSCVRCTWVTMDPENVDSAIETYRMATLPSLEEIPGFCSASLLVDRTNGRSVSSSTYDSRESMIASRDAANAVRSRTVTDMGAQITDVQEFDLVLAHLHVPETV